MRSIRPLTLAAAAATLAITSIGAPVAAEPTPELVVVQGIPGDRFDLCVNGEEVKRGFRYGHKTKPGVEAGRTKVVLKPRVKGACKGDTIAKLVLDLKATEQPIVVARLRRGQPILHLFSDEKIKAPAPAILFDRAVVAANATSVGTVDGWLSTGVSFSSPFPTFPGIKKGEQRLIGLGLDGTVAAWFTKPGKVTSLLLPAVQLLQTGKRHHFVLVGTAKGNLRIVTFRTSLPGS